MNLLSNARDALDEKEGGRRKVEGERESLDTPRLSRVATEEPRIEGQGYSGQPVDSLSYAPSSEQRLRIEGQEAKGAWQKRLVIRTRLEGGWVVAEVEDNGVGIDEAHLSRLFEPFFTTKPADRGTGIGLSICYAIVQNHGGQIACESRKGEGTVFRVALPAVREV